MSATLIISTKEGDKSYNYTTLKELGEMLVGIFRSTDHPTGATLITSDDKGGETVVRVGS